MIPLIEPSIGAKAKEYILDCLDSGWISYAGGYVDKIEEGICKYTGAKHAIATNSGTAGIMLALKLAGVGGTDEVIVPTLTFIATVNAVRHLGAHPVFMDCDDYLNIDQYKVIDFIESKYEKTLFGLRNKSTRRILKAILPVHVFGTPADLDHLMIYAREKEIPIVEDAAESLGSWFTEGNHTGTAGKLGVFSFSFNKIITGGTGGIIVTNDGEIAKRGKYLSLQAKDDPVRYIHNDVGYNLGLTNLNAALALSQLEQIDSFIHKRHATRMIYEERFMHTRGVKMVDIPSNCLPNYWIHGIIVEPDKYGMDREELMIRLGKKGIQARPLWGLNHQQKPYKHYYAHKIEKAKYYYDRVLNIPSGNTLTPEQIEIVAETINNKGR